MRPSCTVLLLLLGAFELACEGTAPLAAVEVPASVSPRPDAGTTTLATHVAQEAGGTSEVLRLTDASLSAVAGETLTLGMNFVGVPMAEDYEVFVHFVDASGQHAADMNADHSPPGGTARWSGPVSYVRTFSLPVDAAPGAYDIRVGLYRPRPPYERVALAAAPDVPVDGELRYGVGTLIVCAPVVQPAVPDAGTAASTVVLLGRFDTRDPAGPRCAWTACGFSTRVSGAGLDVGLTGPADIRFQVVVDGAPTRAFKTIAGVSRYRVAENLGAGPHEVQVYRRSEAAFGVIQFTGFFPAPGGSLSAPAAPSGRRLEVVGDSVSAGYGNEGCPYGTDTQNGYLTYGAIAARGVGAEVHVEAWTARGLYRNWDGSTSGTMPSLFGRALPDDPSSQWDFAQWVPEAVVVNLGSNDFAQGDPGQPFIDAFVDFLRELRARYPAALILCTVYPGWPQRLHVDQAISQVGDARVKRFDLEVPDWAGCNGHPSAAAHQQMGASLAARLHEELGW